MARHGPRIRGGAYCFVYDALSFIYSFVTYTRNFFSNCIFVDVRVPKWVLGIVYYMMCTCVYSYTYKSYITKKYVQRCSCVITRARAAGGGGVGCWPVDVGCMWVGIEIEGRLNLLRRLQHTQQIYLYLVASPAALDRPAGATGRRVRRPGLPPRPRSRPRKSALTSLRAWLRSAKRRRWR